MGWRSRARRVESADGFHSNLVQADPSLPADQPQTLVARGSWRERARPVQAPAEEKPFDYASLGSSGPTNEELAAAAPRLDAFGRNFAEDITLGNSGELTGHYRALRG